MHLLEKSPRERFSVCFYTSLAEWCGSRFQCRFLKNGFRLSRWAIFQREPKPLRSPGFGIHVFAIPDFGIPGFGFIFVWGQCDVSGRFSLPSESLLSDAPFFWNSDLQHPRFRLRKPCFRNSHLSNEGHPKLRHQLAGNAEGCRNPWVISSMEDKDAGLSPCNYATTPFPVARSSFISLYVVSRPPIFWIVISLWLIECFRGQQFHFIFAVRQTLSKK